MSKENLFSILDADTDVSVWAGMPYHRQEQAEAEYILVVQIDSDEDLNKFADLIGQPQIKVKGKTNVKSIWHPKLIKGERGSNGNFVWMEIGDE
jgi:hypothetical protein